MSSGYSMLFMPPRPPVLVPATGGLIIGRSRECELRLPSGDASRLHAEIVASAGGFAVRDLGSTNGTFVNGKQVQEHLLRPGDCIEIAGSTITFCQVDGDAASTDVQLSDAQTILEDRMLGDAQEPGRIFGGELAEIPTFAVLQILEMGRKSGLLRIDADTEVGRLWLDDGRPLHAETKSQKGFDAAVSLMHTETGRFSFEPGTATPERTIEANVTELLLEAARAMDEKTG